MLEEPVFKSLPTSEDFSYDGDVDEKWARERYLGKDIEFARRLYHTSDSLAVLHDWNLVGARAFRYYILGACRYLQDENSKDDIDVYSALADLLLKKLEQYPQDLKVISAYVAAFSQWALENHEKFRVVQREYIYGDVRDKYRKLHKRAMQLNSVEE